MNKEAKAVEVNEAEVITNDVVENTPFRLYGSEEKGYKIVLANYVVKDDAPKEEQEEWIKEMTWDKICQMINVLIDINNKNVKNED